MNINNKTPEEIISNFGNFSLNEAQNILDQMPYDYYTATQDYKVSSPKKTIHRGIAMCIDGALLGAALSGLEPRILCIDYPDANHAVLLIKDAESENFGSIGKSRFRELCGRPCEYPDIITLAKSYSRKDGKKVMGYGVHNWSDYFPNWIDSEENINPFIERKWISENKIW